MPAADRIHLPVKNALIKDGWTITAEPYWIQYEDVNVFADLAAEKPSPEGQGNRIVVVEIKSFAGPSPVSELETALGQYQLYRGYLDELLPKCVVYLAVPHTVYNVFFQRKGIQMIIRRYSVALLVVDTTAEEIVKWIS